MIARTPIYPLNMKMIASIRAHNGVRESSNSSYLTSNMILAAPKMASEMMKRFIFFLSEKIVERDEQ